MFDFRRIILFCLEKRLSKHKMTIFSKNLGRAMALLTPLSTPMPPTLSPPLVAPIQLHTVEETRLMMMIT